MKYQTKPSLQVDLAFKAFLGRDTLESNLLLTDLINTILDPPKDQLITSVKIVNPYNTELHVDDKLTILDIKAETNLGELIDIEMQMSYTSVFRSRSIYYWAKLHGSQLNKGEGYEGIKKSICINIMSEKCFHENNRSHNTFEILERKDKFLLSSDLEIHYVQLPLIDDTIDVDIMDSLTKWMVFFKDVHKPDKESIISRIVAEKGVMELAFDEYSKISADDMLREHLEAREKFIKDVKTDKYFARKDGLEEGLKQGIEQGLEQGRLEVAKQLLTEFSDIKISELTGLTIEKISDLRNED